MRILVAALAATALIAPSADAALPPLHAKPDVAKGGRIVDSQGRTVLLRGVNVNALGEYWKGTQLPTVFPLAPRDPARIQGIGWNAVRLLLSWSRVEPQPGVYDEAYLDQAAAVVSRLQRRGIYTILDMHQDAWGASLAARPGELCLPPSAQAIGWDGAPAWATLDLGLPRCFTSVRELNPAVGAAWKGFFADLPGPGGVGVQTRYVRMFGHLAQRFAKSSAVAGFDLINEPGAFTPDEQAALSKMYERAIVEIRAGEKAGNGTRHLVFFEPSALFSAVGKGPPPPFRHDRDVVYAPHIYTGGFDGQSATRDAFDEVRTEAKLMGGVPVLSGEWGADPKRTGKGGYFQAHQALQDDFGFSATLWTWRESCGDPHKVGDFRAGRVPEVWGEFDVDCRTNTVLGERSALMADLTRSYLRAAPGTIDRMTFDPSTGKARWSGRSPRTRARIEGFLAGGAMSGGMVSTGLTDIRVRRLPGGGALVSARPAGGAWALTG